MSPRRSPERVQPGCRPDAVTLIVGVLEVRLAIREAYSLKDKRRVLSSLEDRLRDGFGVAVAEIGAQDAWQQAVLGIATVGSDRRVIESALSKVMDRIHANPSLEVIGQSVEFR